MCGCVVAAARCCSPLLGRAGEKKSKKKSLLERPGQASRVAGRAEREKGELTECQPSRAERGQSALSSAPVHTHLFSVGPALARIRISI